MQMARCVRQNPHSQAGGCSRSSHLPVDVSVAPRTPTHRGTPRSIATVGDPGGMAPTPVQRSVSEHPPEYGWPARAAPSHAPWYSIYGTHSALATDTGT